MTEDANKRDYRETLFLPKTDFPMRAGLPKAEPKWLERWEKLDIYGQLRAAAKGRKQYVLHDGPPYANGHLHLGTAMQKVLKDFVVRSHQMMGYDAPYVPGWDCHGLPIEWKVEEQYRKKGRNKDDVPRAEFRKECRDYAAGWLNVQREEFKRLGVQGEWDNPYTTMDYTSEAAIAGEFLKFAASDQLYRGSKPVMWSPVEQTALAEAEVEYADHVSTTIWVRFPVLENLLGYIGEKDPKFLDEKKYKKTKPLAKKLAGASVLIWTTTPWTIPGNRAISYHPNISYGLYEVTEIDDSDFTPWSRVGEKLIVAESLWEAVAKAAKIKSSKKIATIKGEEFAHLLCAHPFAGEGYDFDVPLLSGDHVTEEAGTGFVHTAPGHGAEDYDVWLANGYKDIPETVGPDGAYYDHVPLFAGLQVIRTTGKKTGKDGPANAAVVEKLIEVGALLARGRIEHSYPHSWRSKAPVIFRNTPQWFIPMGADDGLREKAVAAIENTRFYPKRGKTRLLSMVEGRPDWLISRQRAWGVPLTLFVKKGTGDYLKNEAVNARILEAFAAEGADAWFADNAQERFLDGLVDDWELYEKVEDILDVWFDSGCAHVFTLENREGLKWPADLYLEGTDQHRGWFQSSLLESCGTRGRAPYDAVFTHGFVMADDGRKMSKSLGNVIDPADIARTNGVEILRLWVASSDVQDDMRMGPEILKGAADSYRKVRNTLRYLLGALQGFDEAERVDPKAMPSLERLMLHRLSVMDEQVRAAYEALDYKRVFSLLFAFCNEELSAFYFDIRKDALYCDPLSSSRRLAARTVMDLIFNRLVIWFAPLLPFTMEEVWLTRFPSETDSVHLHTFPDTPKSWRDEKLAQDWTLIKAVRRKVTNDLEGYRRDKRIGSSLEAAPTITFSNDKEINAFERQFASDSGQSFEEFVGDIFITSRAILEVRSLDEIQAIRENSDETEAEKKSARLLSTVASPVEGSLLVYQPTLFVFRSSKNLGLVKCARSWKYFDPATADPDFKDITPRDAQAVREWDAAHG
ncbi:MAG: isoleucine--tRNA ligase [Robiginitomaculum sp.]|nr:MAG: isoleucine--tRNA ligase [Robiginitomaculum sp.]